MSQTGTGGGMTSGTVDLAGSMQFIQRAQQAEAARAVYRLRIAQIQLAQRQQNLAVERARIDRFKELRRAARQKESTRRRTVLPSDPAITMIASTETGDGTRPRGRISVLSR